MRTIKTLLLAFVLFSCSNDKKENKDGKVYLRTYYSAFGGGSLDISWIYLGDDGIIVQNPVHGVNPVDIHAERADNEKNVGSYQLKDDKLFITWDNDRTTEWGIEKEDGNITIINGGIVTQPETFEKGETIRGSFSAMALGGSFSRVQTFIFKKDGSFEINTSTAVSNEYVNEIGENNAEGEYELEGNTLRLKFKDGKTQLANIAHWKEEDGKMHLVINDSSFPQEN